MKPILLALFCFSVFSVSAQRITDFKHLQCEGEMPDDFKTAFSEKYQSDFEASTRQTDLSKNDAQEFAVLTNYYNHALLTGGSVLYGDVLSRYANDILDKLLTNHEDLRSKLRVYTIKSNQVNAYSTNQGIIYVTLGLLAKVENEAQLAYVLAHEISHYNNQHVLHSFENQKEIWSRGGSYRDMDVEERTLTAYKYSREAEFEADKEALIYYLGAGYSTQEIFKGFDVLLHGYLPIEQIAYSFSKLENDSFKISDYYLIDSIADIKDNDDIDDEFLTHPNIQKRKKAVAKEVTIDSLAEKQPIFLIKSKDEFNDLRNVARFEMVNTYLRQGNYISCLYHIQVLQQYFPEHKFLKRAELMCWYGMQKMATNQQKKVYSSGYRDMEGEEQALYYFASKLPKRGVNILATKFIWEQSNYLEQDSFIVNIKRQSLMHLAETVKKDFFDAEYQTKKESSTNKKRRPKKLDFLKIAFVELFKDSEFKRAFDLSYKDENSEEDEYDDDEEDEDYVTPTYTQGVSSYYGLSNVDKLLFLSPKFYSIDLRKDLDKRLLHSDKEQNDLTERTKKLSALAGVELVTMDKQSIADQATESFNDYVNIRDWLREESLYNGYGFYSYATSGVQYIREKYGTDYLGLNYISHFKDINQFNGGYFLLSAILVYPFPFYLYWQIKPIQNLDYMFLVFDLKQGDVGFYEFKSFPSGYKKDVVNSHLYNSFNQLNRGR